jgi:predicted O-methyltransferase YrrM
MDKETFYAVDQLISENLVQTDEALDACITRCKNANLPEIQVAPNQGKQLMLLARAIGATRILEIGALGGYSTIWLARGLPTTGHCTTLELHKHHADVARTNIAEANLADRVSVITGPALDTLPDLADAEPFDLVFIDANKDAVAEYYEWSLKLTKPGAVIIVDNAIRNGAVLNPPDPGSLAMRELIESLAQDTRVSATSIQTVGEKGYDGFIMMLVNP